MVLVGPKFQVNSEADMSTVIELTSLTDRGQILHSNSLSDNLTMLECQSNTAVEPDLATLQSDYLCARCNAKCPTKSVLVKHMTFVHKLFHGRNSTKFGHKIDAKFFELAVLNQHLLSVRPKRNFQCSKCPQIFQQKFNFVRHSFNKHGKKISNKCYKCEECGQIFSNLQTLLAHQLRHKPPQFSCNKCDQKFFHWGGVVLHTKKAHLGLMSRVSLEVSKFSCQHCPQKCTNATSLQQHLANVHLPKAHKCPHCYREFPTETPLTHHLVMSHSVKLQPNTTCKICSKVCKDHKGLLVHMEFHGNPTYSCDQCALKFYSSRILGRHVIHTHTQRYAMPTKISSKEINFTCAVCCRPFGIWQHLSKHLEIHYYKPQICTICHLGFTSEEPFRAHMVREHFPVSRELIQCDICAKSFMKPEIYQRHRKYHDKPTLACRYCPLMFYTTVTLSNHLASHNSDNGYRNKQYPKGTNVFGCASCSRKYPARWLLKEHLINIHYPPTFSCAKCHFQCHAKGNLKRHLKDFH